MNKFLLTMVLVLPILSGEAHAGWLKDKAKQVGAVLGGGGNSNSSSGGSGAQSVGCFNNNNERDAKAKCTEMLASGTYDDCKYGTNINPGWVEVAKYGMSCKVFAKRKEAKENGDHQSGGCFLKKNEDEAKARCDQ